MVEDQKTLARAQSSLLESRVASLKAELEVAVKHKEHTDKELEECESKWNSLRDACHQRKEHIETDHDNDIQEYKRQIKLAEEMLLRKKEERSALLDYLYDSNICERSTDELKGFDWESLKSITARSRKSLILEEQQEKAANLAKLNDKARAKFDELCELLSSTMSIKNGTIRSINEFSELISSWKEKNEAQEKMIIKMRSENERLNLLIKQCVSTDEPISEYVTKNVIAKCQSFLASDSTEELLNGLEKYKTRQERIIRLLKHKETKLSRDTSLLQVATDQTADQMQYFSGTSANSDSV